MLSTVRGRRRADPAREGTSKRIDVAEAASAGDLFQGGIAGFEKTPDGLDADGLDIGGGRQAGLGPEQAREMPWTQAGSLGEPVDSMVLCRTGRDPPLHLLQGLATHRGAEPPAAELHLAATALEEHDELRRDPA